MLSQHRFFQQVPDYLEYVDHPMDFSTMRTKVEGQEYRSIDEFSNDFELIVNNCMTYNDTDTMYYKAAVKLKEQVSVCVLQLQWLPVYICNRQVSVSRSSPSVSE